MSEAFSFGTTLLRTLDSLRSRNIETFLGMLLVPDRVETVRHVTWDLSRDSACSDLCQALGAANAASRNDVIDTRKHDDDESSCSLPQMATATQIYISRRRLFQACYISRLWLVILTLPHWNLAKASKVIPFRRTIIPVSHDGLCAALSSTRSPHE